MSALDEARTIAGFSDNLAGSPDARSVPYLLKGILHALIAIAENPTQAGYRAGLVDGWDRSAAACEYSAPHRTAAPDA